MKIIESLIKAKANQLSILLKKCYSEQELYQQSSILLSEDIERLTSDELAQLFSIHAPIAGVDSAAYKSRILELADGNQVLCGIRFRGLDVERPFVNVAATTKALTVSQIKLISDEISQAFRTFRPQHVQFYIASHLSITPEDFDDAHWDYRILAGPITQSAYQLSLNTSMNSQPNCEIHRAKTLDFYPQYVQDYHNLLAQNPAYTEMTEVKSIEDMTEWLAQGLIYLLTVDDALAGIIVLERDNSLGLTGFYVNENLVFKDYRGLGLGKWMQQAVIQTLNTQPSCQPTDMLFGTIHHDNIAAIKTAKSVGRQDIGGYLWVGV